MNQTDGQQPTILVAEDDEDNRLVMKMLLELRGYRVLVAANGHEALTLAERESPDLILMDLRMPQLNGLATARHLRQHERMELRRVPIIALSAYDPSQHRNVALAAGCNGSCCSTRTRSSNRCRNPSPAIACITSSSVCVAGCS